MSDTLRTAFLGCYGKRWMEGKGSHLGHRRLHVLALLGQLRPLQVGFYGHVGSIDEYFQKFTN